MKNQPMMPSAHVPKVLVVEDDPNQAYYLESLLLSGGYEVVKAIHGKEALERLQQESFDIIISDILMPIMDGFLLCKEVKSNPDFAGIPFIFFTATYTDDSDEQLAYRVGANAFIRKAVEPDEFLTLLAEVKNRPEHQKEIAPIAGEETTEKEVFKLYSERLIVRLERKMIALREREELYRTLFQESDEGILLHELDGKIIDVNPAVVKMFGYTREEMLGRPVWEFHKIKDSNAYQNVVASFKQSGQGEYDLECIKKDSTPFIISVSSKKLKLKRKDVVLSVLRDVTKKRREELVQKIIFGIATAAVETTNVAELFEKIREVLSLVIDTSNFFVALYNEGADFLSLPYHQDRFDQFEKIALQGTFTGYTLRQGKTVFLREKEILELIRKGEVEQKGALSKVWVGIPLRIENNTVGILVIQNYENENAFSEEDISLLEFVSTQIAQMILRKKNEEKLKRLAMVLEQLFEMVILVNTEGKIEYINPTFENLTGYSREMSIGKSLQTLLPEQQKSQLLPKIWDHLTSGIMWHGQFKLTRQDGSRFPVDAVFSPIYDQAGNISDFVIVMRDITHELEMEERLRQSQKMEVIGRLAGGIAHDFNNMLSVIIGYGEMLLDQLHPKDPLWELTKQIVDAGERSAALTNQLLAFSRKQTLQPKVINLNNIIRDLEKILKRLIGEDIDLNLNLSKDIAPVLADVTQIEQVIMNLAINARDAMPEGGKLIIETANVELDADYARLHVGAKPGKYVMLAISDTGCGMDKETRSKIFEPFFTTKEKGKGTGLGLSTVYGIIKQSGGNIWVYSELGKGTTFKIYLPQTDAPADEENKKTTMETTTIGKHILVVEDEVALRNMIRSLLTRLKYKVTVAANGGEALFLLEKKGLKPDLVITDVVMPHMSGKELVETLLEKYPDLKVLYMSGYTDDAIVHHGVLDKGIHFIQKPFSVNDFSRKIQEVLKENGNNQNKLV